MEIIKIQTTDSTNNYLSQHEEEVAPTALLYCINQTAGRGQRGNSWESEPGKNITASVIFHPRNFPARCQFALSQAVALGINDYLRSRGVETKVKWPNDIYAGDKKICGILVEHVVVGSNISRTIAGFGINLNQEKFVSDAPNPVSLRQLTGKEYIVDEEVKDVAEAIERRLASLSDTLTSQYNPQSQKSEIELKFGNLHKDFLAMLWRGDGNFYPFHDRIRNERVEARIEDVGPDGMLTLVTTDDEKRCFSFKEVEFLL